MLEDDEAGRDVLELLAGLLADRPALAAALGAGAVLGGDVVDDPLAGQARRQRLAAVAVGRRLRRGRSGRLRRGSRRLGLGQEVVREEQQLIGVDLLALLAVAVAQQSLELVLEPGDELGLLPQGVRLLADLAVGRVDVVGECGVAGRHTP